MQWKPYIEKLHMQWTLITGSRCKLGSAPPSRDYEYVAHLSNRKECTRAIHRKIRPSTATNNESSWVWGEDGYYHPPHELTTGGRSAKSHVCNWCQMTSYRRARWCIRNIFSKFRAFSKRPQRTKKYQIPYFWNLLYNVHCFDPKIWPKSGTYKYPAWICF